MTVVASRMRLTLIEYMAPFANRIDKENRVIRGVKIIGLHSGNSVRVVGIDSDETYDYLPEALEAAIEKYEGVVVNLDHPDFELDRSGERHAVSATKTLQRFGRLINVHFIEGKGLFGDLEYLAEHPQAPMILEAIERMPETLALSHNARGNVTKINGKFVVDEIGEVKSVDLIAEKPGTTHSLFEQLTDKENMMAQHFPGEQRPKIEALHGDEMKIEALHGGEEKPRLVPEQGDEETRLVPEEEHEREEVVEQEDVTADPVAMVDSAFRAAINALLDDDSISDEELTSKLTELVTKRAETKAVLTGGNVSEQEEDEHKVMTEQEEEEKTIAEQEEDGKKVITEQEEKKNDATGAIAESLAFVVRKHRKLKRENETLKRESVARDLLESKGVKASEAKIKALASLGTRKLQVELIESFSSTSRPQRPGVTKRRVQTSGNSEFPKGPKSFAAACR